MRKKYLQPTIEVVIIEIEETLLADSYEGSALDQILPGTSMGEY